MPQHSLPVFEGRWSHRHAPFEIDGLEARADADLAQHGPIDAHTYLQFAGFPRSGHSLVGAIVGRHPDAVVSHELDVMGLLEAGMTRDRVLALTRLNAAEFAASGQWWNGFCYAAANGTRTQSKPAAVFGDKKGDRVLRRFARDPGIFDALPREFADMRRPWIVVLRNPYDNVATMSLRKGRHYDRARIRASKTAAPVEVPAETPRSVLPEMVEDYAGLCQTLAAFQASHLGQDMLVLRHEALLANPAHEIRRLYAFLGLASEDTVVDAAMSLVNPVPHHSRFDLSWPDDLRDRVAGLIDRYAFLAKYDWAE